VPGRPPVPRTAGRWFRRPPRRQDPLHGTDCITLSKSSFAALVLRVFDEFLTRVVRFSISPLLLPSPVSAISHWPRIGQVSSKAQPRLSKSPCSTMSSPRDDAIVRALQEYTTYATIPRCMAESRRVLTSYGVAAAMFRMRCASWRFATVASSQGSPCGLRAVKKATPRSWARPTRSNMCRWMMLAQSIRRTTSVSLTLDYSMFHGAEIPCRSILSPRAPLSLFLVRPRHPMLCMGAS
jgi:hypothetical protein